MLRTAFAALFFGAAVAVAGCSSSSVPPPIGVSTTAPSATPSGTSAPILSGATPTPSPTATASASAAPSASPSAIGSPAFASTNVPILSSGGTAQLPPIGTFTASVGYAPNNAPAGTTATVETSTTDAVGAPAAPSGTAVYYVSVLLNQGVNGTLTFAAGATTPTATITSSSLLAGTTYSIDAFEGTTLLETVPVGSPVNGALSFQSPFTAQTVLPGTPLYLELIQN